MRKRIAALTVLAIAMVAAPMAAHADPEEPPAEPPGASAGAFWPVCAQVAGTWVCIPPE
jgi:hypothetical protein